MTVIITTLTAFFLAAISASAMGADRNTFIYGLGFASAWFLLLPHLLEWGEAALEWISWFRSAQIHLCGGSDVCGAVHREDGCKTACSGLDLVKGRDVSTCDYFRYIHFDVGDYRLCDKCAAFAWNAIREKAVAGILPSCQACAASIDKTLGFFGASRIPLTGFPDSSPDPIIKRKTVLH